MNRIQRNCPFCRNAGTPLYNNIMAAVGSIDLSYEVRGCSHCGSVFADQLAPQANYDRYYATMSKYDSASVPDDSDTSHCHHLLTRLIREVAPVESRVLDIGCGSGHLLFCLKKAGYRHLRGVDPSPQSAASARDYFGLEDVHPGFIDTIAATSHLDDCDVCCLTGVLEHLYAPLEQLEPVTERLKPGARLVIGVPDLDDFTTENREPYGELSLEHINFFSRRSLVAFFARLGCRLETCTTYRGQNKSSLLLAVAVKSGQPVSQPMGWLDDAPVMTTYLAMSEIVLVPRLASLSRLILGDTVVYGAGSHTARLLPRLKALGLLKHCVAVVDRNRNLYGETFGGLPVFEPAKRTDFGKCDILVSSFHSENEIAATLKDWPNKVLTIYNQNQI